MSTSSSPFAEGIYLPPPPVSSGYDPAPAVDPHTAHTMPHADGIHLPPLAVTWDLDTDFDDDFNEDFDTVQEDLASLLPQHQSNAPAPTPAATPTPTPAPASSNTTLLAPETDDPAALRGALERISNMYAIVIQMYRRDILSQREEAARAREADIFMQNLDDENERLERELFEETEKAQYWEGQSRLLIEQRERVEGELKEYRDENRLLASTLARNGIEVSDELPAVPKGPLPPPRRAKRAKATTTRRNDSWSSTSSSTSNAVQSSSGSSSASGSSSSGPASIRQRDNYAGLAIPAIYAPTHTSPTPTIKTQSSFVLSAFGSGVNDLDEGPSAFYDDVESPSFFFDDVNGIDAGPTAPFLDNAYDIDSPSAPPFCDTFISHSETTTHADGTNFVILNDYTNGVRIERTLSRTISEDSYVDVSPDEIDASDDGFATQPPVTGLGLRITEPAPLMTTTVKISVEEGNGRVWTW